MKKLILILIAVMAVLLTGCATASNPPDVKSVHYSGGVLSAKKFQNCLDPSERSGYDPGDGYFGYPTRQVSYDATGGKGAETDPFKVVSKDNAELHVPISMTFNLITDCDTLRKLHETIGSRFDAAIRIDEGAESSADYPDGWIDLLNFVIGKPLDATLDRVAQNFNWRAIWNDPAVKAEFERAVTDNIDDLVNRQAGGEFFENFQVLIQKPDPVDQALKDAITREQANIADAQAAKAKAEADEATARAQVALARAEAAKRRAEIAGYGGIANYLRALCIESGCNPYQPTYLYGGSPQ